MKKAKLVTILLRTNAVDFKHPVSNFLPYIENRDRCPKMGLGRTPRSCQLTADWVVAALEPEPTQHSKPTLSGQTPD
jgi:hypothetical protein